MRTAIQIAAGVAIGLFGVYLVLASGARPGEELVDGRVVSVEVIERSDGRAFDHFQHRAAFADPITGQERFVESGRYRQDAPLVGERIDVFVDSETNEARVAGPESQRNGFIALAFGIALVAFSLLAALRDRSS